MPSDPDTTRLGEPQEAPILPSETFANFRILRRSDGSLFRLGQGGMGVTYKAVDTTLERPVALKLIGSNLLKSTKARQRFLREAKAAAKIVHPNVATVFQFGEEGDLYFYAMEFLEGEDLDQYVDRRGPLPPRGALRVAHQIARALEAAQARQLIHRDIKPGNIMTSVNRVGDLEVKLIDFGLARLADASDSEAGRITHSLDFVGSPAFASPEQCEMSAPLDTRSDIYSLGVTLWYLLTAKLPFSGSVGQLLIAHATKSPPWEELEHLPEPLVALLRRMLAKDPNERHQTPTELQEAIEEILAGLVDSSATDKRGAAPASSGLTHLTTSGQGGSGEQSQLTFVHTPHRLGSYPQIGAGSVLGDRYRIIKETREGIGGRVFLAKDEKSSGREPATVALKLLHPAIVADPSLVDRLENEIRLICSAIAPHLVRYFGFSRQADPFLVRQWVHGFLLYDLLRRRRICGVAEVMKLLDPLASTLDFVVSQGLGLVEISTRKILIACPPDIEEFSSLGTNSEDWDRCVVKLNPLSLGPLILHSRPVRGDQTLVPSGQILSLTGAEVGVRGIRSVRLFGHLVYELLSGHLPTDPGGVSARYSPLPALNEAGNRTLQRACTGSDPPFACCTDFWRALQESIDSRRTTPPPAPFPERQPEVIAIPSVPSDKQPLPDIGPDRREPTRQAQDEPIRRIQDAKESLINQTPSLSTAPQPIREAQGEPIRHAQVERLPEQLPHRPLELATKQKPWVNSLDMRFVPLGGVFFCVSATRLQDFEQFIQQSEHDASAMWREPGFKQGPDHPVVNVSWIDAKAFCSWLTQHEKRLGLLPARLCYRLPTDHEWSVAAGLENEPGNTPEQKKGKTKVYPWGVTWPPPPGAGNYCGEECKTGRSGWPVIAGYRDNYPRTSPTAAFAPNRYGLYDMGGNVWQWCEDWYNPRQLRRVLRGASWLNEHPDDLLTSHRRDDSPGSRRDNYGFRCVIAPLPEE